MHIPAIGLLRFCAAMIIVIYHYRYVPIENQVEFAFWPCFNGVQMVTLFFVLSGFVNYLAYGTASSTRRNSTGFFFTSRAARILPLYFVSFLLSVVLFSLAGKEISSTTLLMHTFLLQAWHPDYSGTLNFVSWTLSADLFLYLTFPLLLLLKKNQIGLIAIVVVNVVVFVVTQVVLLILVNADSYMGEPSAMFNFVHHFPLFHLTSFMWGMLAGYLIHSYRSHLWWFSKQRIQMTIYLFSGVLVFGVPYLEMSSAFFWATSSIYAPIFAIFLIALSLSKGRFIQLLDNPCFNYLGNLSYGIYLFQIIVWYLYDQLIATNFKMFSPEQHFFMGVTLLIIIAMAFYHSVEKPSNRLIRKRMSKSKPLHQKEQFNL